MQFRIQCSSGHILVIPERWAGAKFHCPKCGAAVLVPGIAQDEAIVLDGEIDSMILSTVPASSLVVEAATPVVGPSPILETISNQPTATNVARGTKPVAAMVTPPTNETTKRNAMDQHPHTTQERVPNQNTPSVNINTSTVSPPATVSPVSSRPIKNAKPKDPKHATALHLGMLVLAVAVFSVLPAVWEWLAIWQHAGNQSIPPWVYASLVTGTVLFAYGIYVAQLPDWSSLWMATFALLFTAACYAALLASTWLGTDENSLVTLLKYGDKLAGHRAAMWCFIMLSISSVTAYFLGHSAVQWYNAYRLLRPLPQR